MKTKSTRFEESKSKIDQTSVNIRNQKTRQSNKIFHIFLYKHDKKKFKFFKTVPKVVPLSQKWCRLMILIVIKNLCIQIFYLNKRLNYKIEKKKLHKK